MCGSSNETPSCRMCCLGWTHTIMKAVKHPACTDLANTDSSVIDSPVGCHHVSKKNVKYIYIFQK